MLNVAIIPARGGSKGITKKNLRKINGKSLLQRAIESAKIQNVHKCKRLFAFSATKMRNSRF